MSLPRLAEPVSEQTAVLLVGYSEENANELRSALTERYRLVGVASETALLQELERGSVSVVCFGPLLSPAESHRLLRTACEQRSDPHRQHLVLSAGDELELFQGLLDEDRIFYLSRGSLAAGDLAGLIESAVARRRSLGAVSWQGDGELVTDRILQRALRQAMQQSSVELMGQVIEQAVLEAFSASRARLLLYDFSTDTLQACDPSEDGGESAAVGILSFVARSHTALRVERLAKDSRFDAEADNPYGGGDDGVLAVPILAAERGDGGEAESEAVLVGVLAAYRAAEERPFSLEEERRLEAFGWQLAPSLKLMTREHLGEGVPEEQLFRSEALAHHRSGWKEEGDLLHIAPVWTDRLYWAVLSAFVFALLFSFVGRVSEYAMGPGVITAADRSELTSPVVGTVERLWVQSGARVEAGQELVTLANKVQAANLERVEKEIRLQILNRLRHPSDPATERALMALHAERDLVAAELEQRIIRAPRSGVVSEVRVSSGRSVAPGQILLSLRSPEPNYEVVALLPGRYRPQLEAGMPLRLELSGYRYSYRTLEVSSVGAEVVSASEARRLLGADSEALPLQGAVVFVRARIEGERFRSGNDTYRLHDGMHATAEVRVRHERILVALLPFLRTLREGES